MTWRGRGFNEQEVRNLRSWGVEPRPDEIEPRPDEIEPRPDEIEPRPIGGRFWLGGRSERELAATKPRRYAEAIEEQLRRNQEARRKWA